MTRQYNSDRINKSDSNQVIVCMLVGAKSVQSC